MITACDNKGGKVSSANLHEMVNPGKQLGVDGKSAVELVPRLSNQPLGKLSLEHKNRAPGCWFIQATVVTKARKLTGRRAGAVGV